METDHVLIAREISSDEPCLRCVYSPLQYSESKRRLKPNAVLPPPRRDRNDVSLSRLRYISSIEVCIGRGRDILMGENRFCGIASFTRGDVWQVNGIVDETVVADIVYAPMRGDRYVDTTVDIYMDDCSIDKGDHAELRYNRPYNSDDVVNTALRRYATQLVRRMTIVHLEPDT